jgi:hypothetical protein
VGKEERCVHTGFPWEKTRSERDHLEYLTIDWRIILKWTGLILLRVRTSGGAVMSTETNRWFPLNVGIS